MWIAETFVNGQWVIRAMCESKFVASLALTRDQLAGRETKLWEKK
jgi:hypothetical protein